MTAAAKRGPGRPRAGTVQIATRAPGELVARLDAAADALGIDRSEALREAIADWIAREAPPEAATCAKCGRPRGAHNVRHPFVAAGRS